jgi:hypothetical protein
MDVLVSFHIVQTVYFAAQNVSSTIISIGNEPAAFQAILVANGVEAANVALTDPIIYEHTLYLASPPPVPQVNTPELPSGRWGRTRISAGRVGFIAVLCFILTGANGLLIWWLRSTRHKKKLTPELRERRTQTPVYHTHVLHL